VERKKSVSALIAKFERERGAWLCSNERLAVADHRLLALSCLGEKLSIATTPSVRACGKCTPCSPSLRAIVSADVKGNNNPAAGGVHAQEPAPRPRFSLLVA